MEETLRAAHSHFPRHVAHAEVRRVHRFDYYRLSCSAVVRHHRRFPAVVVFLSRRAPVLGCIASGNANHRFQALLNGWPDLHNSDGIDARLDELEWIRTVCNPSGCGQCFPPGRRRPPTVPSRRSFYRTMKAGWCHPKRCGPRGLTSWRFFTEAGALTAGPGWQCFSRVCIVSTSSAPM